MPASQAVQVEAPVPVNVLVTEPAAQLLQLAAPAAEYVPAAQDAHATCEDAV